MLKTLRLKAHHGIHLKWYESLFYFSFTVIDILD